MKVKETIFFVPNISQLLINILVLNKRPVSPAVVTAARTSVCLFTRI